MLTLLCIYLIQLIGGLILLLCKVFAFPFKFMGKFVLIAAGVIFLFAFNAVIAVLVLGIWGVIAIVKKIHNLAVTK